MKRLERATEGEKEMGLRPPWEGVENGLGAEEAHRARILRVMGLVMAGTAGLILVVELFLSLHPRFPPVPRIDLILDGLAIAVGGLTVWLVRSRRTQAAAWAVIILLLIASTLILVLEERPNADVAGTLGLLMTLAFAFALLERRTAWVVLGAATAVLLATQLLWRSGYLPEPVPRSQLSYASFVSVTWAVTAGVVAAILHSTMTALRGQAETLRDQVDQLRQKEHALRESRRQLTTLMSNLPGMAYRCKNNPDWTMEFVSEGCHSLTGYCPEELTGNAEVSYGDLIVPEDRQYVWDAIQEALADRRSFELTYRIVASDGQEKWVREQGQGLVDGDGGVVALEGFITDITERKRMEDALRESEERLRVAASNLDGILYVLDTDLRFRLSRGRGLDLLDLGQDQILGMSLHDFLVTDDPDHPMIARHRRVLAGETLRFETERDGIVFSTIVSPIKDAQGKIVGAVGVSLDITERKRMEEALWESEHRFRLVTETIKDVFWISTCGVGEMVYVSPAYETLWGRPIDSLYESPQSFLDVIHPDDLEGYLDVIDAYHERGRPYDHEYRIVREDGDVRWIRERGYPVPGSSGEVQLMTGVCTDVTERKEMGAQLRQQERLAAVGQLAGGVAHDFNNILASITLYAQMSLSRPGLAPETRSALEIILEESHRAADLTDQILDFSRRTMMDKEVLSLVDLVENALGILRRTIPEDIDLVANLGSDPCFVQADSTRIHQVLMNLALNARDAMPGGGRLEIQVGGVELGRGEVPHLPELGPGRWACLRVSDTGTGMTAEIQDHLFEPFFTTKEEGKGTGLGLAQVYGIVKQHGGHVDVETAPGEGSTFIVYLPVVEHQRVQEADETTGPIVAGRGETILVVEDAEQILRAIEAGLEDLGYHVLTAGNGREALENRPFEDVDLVLTDVVMPEVGGLALLKKLRAEAPDLKVVAMTGYVMDARVNELKDAGFAELISKPFCLEELTGVVRDVLDC